MTIEEEFEAERLKRHEELSKVCDALVEAYKDAPVLSIITLIDELSDKYAKRVMSNAKRDLLERVSKKGE